MKKIKYILITFTLTLLVHACNSRTKPESSDVQKETSEISFFASDSIEVFGDLHITDKSAPSIVLFHQGGSNGRAEYKSIIPKLKDSGYNVLSIDQRVGGQWYGGYNRTASLIEHLDYGYCDAYPDMVGALDYLKAKKLTGKIILWGSSYSGTLAIQLAHSRPNDVDAVLAFSPASGPPMADCQASVYLESLTVPLIILRPGNEAKIESVKAQLALAKDNNHETYVAEDGIHGSSMLVESRTKTNVDSTMQTVFNFLQKHSK
ncbi:alpha/beta fold hydrolase [Winogradskyella maritima]|uniref:Alpha/beta hydrolase n=1 Tax=Winogradskyella maritima TaxID=1517766 RepID=A0ABV8ACF2_9FLAO|nr:alpha/beta fold hydrolase [Winogradskyella maritima]